MMISRWLVGVVLLFAILLMLLPKRDDASLAALSSASMLQCTAAFRAEVAAQVLAGEAVELAFANPCPDLIAALELAETGEIWLSGQRYQIHMHLWPVVEGEQLRWACEGGSEHGITRLCRP
ncbi:MAG: hypothetical protein ACNA75_12350 [Thiohalomonadaceae bacterium]